MPTIYYYSTLTHSNTTGNHSDPNPNHSTYVYMCIVIHNMPNISIYDVKMASFLTRSPTSGFQNPEDKNEAKKILMMTSLS